MKNYMTGIALVVLVFFATVTWCFASPQVIKDMEKTYIVDRHGEKWDVTQAQSVGFSPERFQYGIGRYAFTPLDDSYVTDQTEHVYDGLRVIGVSNDNEAIAYSVSKLRRHEIANSQIGETPIAVGY